VLGLGEHTNNNNNKVYIDDNNNILQTDENKYIKIKHEIISDLST
jgi:hypothetical protein